MGQCMVTMATKTKTQCDTSKAGMAFKAALDKDFGIKHHRRAMLTS